MHEGAWSKIFQTEDSDSVEDRLGFSGAAQYQVLKDKKYQIIGQGLSGLKIMEINDLVILVLMRISSNLMSEEQEILQEQMVFIH